MDIKKNQQNEEDLYDKEFKKLYFNPESFYFDKEDNDMFFEDQDENSTDLKPTEIADCFPETCGGIAGAAGGATISYAALYNAGITGLSSSGITSGLAALGGLIGGGMAAGVFVLSIPITALTLIGVGIAHSKKRKANENAKSRGDKN